MAMNVRAAGALVVVGAGLAVAALLSQVPAFGTVPVPDAVLPSSAGQQLVCPGSALAVGQSGSSASSVTAVGSPAVRSGTDRAARLTTRTLGSGDVKGGGRPVAVDTGTAAADGVLAASQTQTVGTGDALGFVASACTVATGDSWIVGGATTTGRTSVLVLTNPTTVSSTVTLSVWTADGAVPATAGSRVVVPARTRTAVSLAGLAPNASGTVVHAVAAGGRIQLALQQSTVRGLESGGIDMTGPATTPATTQTITGVRTVGSVAVATAALADGYADLQPIVRLFAPGTGSVMVRIRSVSTSGGANVTTKRIDRGRVVDTVMPAGGDDTYTVRVTAAVPIVAAVRVSVVSNASANSDATGSATASGIDGVSGEDGTSAITGADGGSGSGATVDIGARGIDLAWLPAEVPLGARAAVAVAAGPSAQLAFGNPTSAPITVQLAGAASGAVTVRAGGTAVVPVNRGIVAITGGSGLVAAVDYSGDGQIAGFAVAPADQAARAIRVSH